MSLAGRGEGQLSETARDLAVTSPWGQPAAMPVALVHDYLTQRGGAERVVSLIMEAFPEAPLYTSLYAADSTFADLAGQDIRPFGLNLFV